MTTSVDGRVAVLALSGDLDMAGAAVLEAELERLDSDVIADLRELRFLDSSGLRAIVVASRRAAEAGRRFALVAGRAQVMRVFDITGMRERLHFVAPEEVG